MTRWVLGVVLFCALPVRADREVLTIPSYAMPRASDEVKLMALLKQDIEDAHMHHVDYRLRQKINKLAAKIAGEY